MVDTASNGSSASGPLQTSELNHAPSPSVSRKLNEDGNTEIPTLNGCSSQTNGRSAELIVLDDDVVAEEPSPAKKRKLDDDLPVKSSDAVDAASKLTVKKVRIEAMTATKIPQSDDGKENSEDNGDPSASPVKKIFNGSGSDKAQRSSADTEHTRADTKKVIKHLSREELEQIVLEQICLAITQNGATKQMAKKLESAEARVDLYKSRAESLQKQVQDLKTVIQRLINRMRSRNEQNAPKNGRTVGVQVTMNDNLESSNGSKLLVRTASEVPSGTGATGVLAQASTSSAALQPVKIVTSPRIASYVPEQGLPRYRVRSGPQETPVGSVIVLQAATTETVAKASSIVASQKAALVAESPVKGSTVTPKKDVAANQRPAASSSSHVVAIVATPAVTTVNKVMLPTMQPKVIDLTDDEQDTAGNRSKTSTKTAERAPNSSAARPAPQNVITTNMMSSSAPTNGKAEANNGSVASQKPNAGDAHNGDARQLPSAKLPRALVPMLPNTTHPPHPSGKTVPPRPHLTVSLVTDGTGIVLKWNMSLNNQHAKVVAYQLYAYQEGTAHHGTSPWRKISDIKALPLPMACTLTQFHVGNRYHFMVRAVDEFSRTGPYSEIKHIMLPTAASNEQN